jgi:SH3-like domain-containing protein
MRALSQSIGLFCLALLLVSAGSAWAQTGTLQVPSQPAHDRPVNPPTAAPRQPVQKAGSTAGASTPVVKPHGTNHPVKPKSAAGGQSGPQNSTKAPAAAAKPAAEPSPSPPAAEKTEPAEKLPDPEKPEGTAAKLPRFASLRSDDVNMRVGPGTRYRIDWVYKRRDLPVEIEREYDVWRWVRDPDGNHGWVHQATLMGRRSFVVQGADATLRSDASDASAAVAVLNQGVIGRIRSCDAGSDWCNVQTGSYRGYIRRGQIWGVLPGEAVTP